MYNAPQTAEDRLLCQFGQLLKLAFTDNPLEESGISLPQLSLLDWVAVNPGSNVREVADGLTLTPPTVSVAIRRLEDAGYVDRYADPDDGRAVRFKLTAQGLKLYQRALRFRQAKMHLLLSALTSTEIETLLNLLEKAIRLAGAESCNNT